MRRVVVTGLGIVSCLGNDIPSFWADLLAGKSGMRQMSRWDPTGLRNTKMGEVVDFPWTDDHDEASQFALYAAASAIKDSGIVDTSHLGLVSSTNFGGAAFWDQYLACLTDGAIDAETAELFTEFIFSRTADLIKEKYGFNGPTRVMTLSCSSGTAAIGQGMDLIRTGKSSAVLCEGHDSLAYSSMAGLSILRTITADELRPFDIRRSGTIFGEGSGALILEDSDSAVKRGAKIYGEVAGYAVNNNAHHLTAPDKEGDGIVAMLKEALRDAAALPIDVDYINAHGTGTAYFDVTETKAVKTVLGDKAFKIPISSIKPAVGHMMAAAGSVEAIVTLLALRDGIVPPTLNHEQPDPECDLDYVSTGARKVDIKNAISISSGIGGNNSAVVLKKWQGGN
ncbi:MAG: beta-ketoacyl-[acyl-carrier-protein] synthase family protein [bacterium]